MWDFYSRHRKRTSLMLREPYEELLYPFEHPDAGFTRSNLPPILCATLPHLTDRHEELFAELEPVVRSQPRQSPARHFRYLFEWLCGRFERKVWVERSGTSLMLVPRLMCEFPDARFIHIFRDGRETAISMSRHYLFRTVMANMILLRSAGIDALGLMSDRKLWTLLGPRLETLANWFINPERLPYDKAKLADYASFWQVQVDMAHDFSKDLSPERLLNVSFEDILSEPEAQVGRVVRFIDPSLEEWQWLKDVSGIPRPMQPKFDGLDDDDKAAVTEACRPGLQRLGYLV